MNDQTQAVLDVNRAFYDAFINADYPAMESLWAQEHEIAVIHPGWSPLHGRNADIIKIAMLRLHDELLANYKARMILQVHDELLLEVPESEIDAVKSLMIDIMSNAFKLDVPLKVDASTGYNWLELKE